MKRYTTLNDHFQTRFDARVFKVPLDAHLTCPNRDGSLGLGGCIYCSDSGAAATVFDVPLSLKAQYWHHKTLLQTKWPEAKTMPYFQAHTNTYAPLEALKRLYETALTIDPEHTVGLCVSTRPDALDDLVVDYLGDLTQRTFVQVELGLQSIHPKSADWMRRGHDLAAFEDALKRLRRYPIDVVVHIINGLPLETEEDMLETARYLGKQDIQGIKIHMLHITNDSPLGRLYQQSPFALLSKEDYVRITCEQLTYLKKDIVIHRLTGDGLRDVLIAPLWTLKKWEVLNAIDDFMTRQDWHQGCRLTTP